MQAPDTFLMRLRQYTHFCRGWGVGLSAMLKKSPPEQAGGWGWRGHTGQGLVLDGV